MSTQQNYWNHTGKHEQKSKMLQAMIPPSDGIAGKTNKKLERFRKASNCYYDLFNNGLCNRAREFRAVFGFGGKAIDEIYRFNMDCELALRMESVMDAIIIEAFEEQKANGAILPVLEAKKAEKTERFLTLVKEFAHKNPDPNEPVKEGYANEFTQLQRSITYWGKEINETKDSIQLFKGHLEKGWVIN